MPAARSAKVKALRFIWGLIPWLFVGLIVVGVATMVNKIDEKKAILETEKKNATKAEIHVTKVVLLNVQPRVIKDRINLPASVVPFKDLWVKAEVPGQVVKVLAQEGQMVKAGQTIVQLDRRDYKQQIERVKANYRYTKSEYDRQAALAKKKVTARSNLESIEAKLKDLAAQYDSAKLSLDRTSIKAPVTGQLNDLRARKGDVLGVRNQVARILQINQVKITVGVPESDVAAVFDLDEAEITIEALGIKVKGQKLFLSRQPQGLARLYNLELVVSNPNGRILPGMFARVELVKDVFEDALAVPLYTVISQGKEQFVYVNNDGTAEKRLVKLGVLDGWQVQIESGLKPGDKVVVVGHRVLDHGQKIDPLKTVNNVDEIFAQ